MDPKRQLVKLNPKASSWEMYLGGQPEFTRADVLCAVGQVPSRCGQALLLAAWTDDKRSLQEVYDVTLAQVRRRAQKWRKATEKHISGLAALAVEETVGVPLCDTCRGRGTVGKVNDDLSVLVVQCHKCLGFGLRTLSGRERARRVGVDSKNWRLYWEDRYRPVLASLVGEHERALRAVRVTLTQ